MSQRGEESQEDRPEGGAFILGGYGPLTISALPRGRVALDFTQQGGKRGPFVTLTAMEWVYLQRAMRDRPRRPR